MHKAKVYILDTDGLSYDDIYARYFDLIEEDRRSRIEKCASSHSKETILYTGAMLVKLFSDRGVSVSDIAGDEHGKPNIKGRDDLYFNLSHSGTFIVVAVADAPVGIDVQKPVIAREALIDRIASKEEQERNSDLIKERFNLFWAMKESYAKLTGEGIGVDFKGIKAEHQKVFYPTEDYPVVVTMFEEFILEQEMLVL